MKVVIITCNKHAWVITLFLYFYGENWTNNPYKTEIVTESKHIDGIVFYSRDSSWATSIIKYIKQSKEEKFLLILEDYLIRQVVDTKKVRIAEELCTGDIGYVRLSNFPSKYSKRHTLNVNIKGFREYPLNRRFAMTTQIGIYQRDFLFDILRAGETAWQTERNGSERLSKLTHKWKGFWPESCIIDYHWGGLLRKGDLRPAVLKWIKLELSEDNPKYKILQDRIKRQKEKRC